MHLACGLVHPSRHEGFSIVLLEAGLAGCPIVATRVGGISELIENEKSGLLVESENEEELAAAIVKVLANRELAEEMARNLAMRVRGEFTARVMAAKYVVLFRQVSVPEAKQ